MYKTDLPPFLHTDHRQYNLEGIALTSRNSSPSESKVPTSNVTELDHEDDDGLHTGTFLQSLAWQARGPTVDSGIASKTSRYRKEAKYRAPMFRAATSVRKPMAETPIGMLVWKPR